MSSPLLVPASLFFPASRYTATIPGHKQLVHVRLMEQGGYNYIELK